MEFILNRYRNLTVLLIVVTAQLLLIAYQVRTSTDVPLLRVWAVTAVTPVESILEGVRRNTWGFVEDYFFLLHTRRQNEGLQKEVGRLRLENQYLKTQLSTADRAKALSQFEATSPSKMIAARIIGNGTGANSKAVFVDRGSSQGVESGMAVVTPDGIVGKVVAAYPTASLVLLITDANFAAGVISQKNRVRGTLKGQGHDGTVQIDYVQSEEKVDIGEWFYTSGDDRIFPKGFPVGPSTTVRNGRNLKEIYVTPSGFQGGLEEVLIVLDAVHQPIPEYVAESPAIHVLPAPPRAEGTDAPPQATSGVNTDADRLKDQYRQAADEQHHAFGAGSVGSTPPDFTKLPGIRENGAPVAGAKQSPPPTVGGAPAANGTPVPVSGQPAVPQTAVKTNPVVAGQPAAVQQGSRETSVALPPAAVPKPKPKISAPLLVTDPTDADPSEPAVAAQPRRTEADLDEFGQPKARPAPKIPPSATSPKPKPNDR